MIKFNNNIPKGLKAEISATTLEKCNRGQVSNYVSNNNTIEILDEIGESYWSEGVTAKAILSKLNSIGNDKDVDVIINSGGGDVFEGIAIHNVLKQHKGNVTVKIIGLAGSAASIIALGGDEIKIAKNAFFMIHNAWMVGAGNRNDFRAFADFLEPFDNILAETYVDFTGLEQKMIGFLTFTLRPILTRIEQTINNELIPLEDRGIYYAEFSIDGLLRGDSTARATFFREMVNAGIMTRDEVRKLENLPPLGGNAEKLMTNGATQPIDTLQGLN